MTFSATQSRHGNSHNHHHHHASSYNNHHDGNDCAFNDKEWMCAELFEKKKISLDNARVMREPKWHIDQGRRSADSDRFGPSLGKRPVAAPPLREPLPMPIGSTPFRRVRASARHSLGTSISASPTSDSFHRRGRGTKHMPVGLNPRLWDQP